MQVLSEQGNFKTIDFQNKNMLLQRLDRNQKDIAQHYAKLRSYLSEPRTYEQHRQLSELKENARQLRDVNNKICLSLKNDPNASDFSLRTLEAHFRNFDSFSRNVLDYLQEVRTRIVSAVS